METHVIAHPHHEASALIALTNRALLRDRGWREAFWVVGDEAPVERAVAALGRRADAPHGEEWELLMLDAQIVGGGRAKKTEDAETLARAGGFIYVIGSQFGGKTGPLDPKRHFVARFNESLVRAKRDRLVTELEVARPAFGLHRIVNDALAAARVEIVRRPAAVAEAMVEPAVARARDKGKGWGARLAAEDTPINVEGATFLGNGRLLLGLRYPVTADGHPILIELDGIDRLFSRGSGAVEVARIWILTDVGSRQEPRGVRELDQRGGLYHALTGTLEGEDPDSPIRQAIPSSGRAASEHHVFDLPLGPGPVVEVSARTIRRFDGSNVEGLAVGDDGGVWYARDADEIVLEHVPPDAVAPRPRAPKPPRR
jgi:hypothetical protein